MPVNVMSRKTVGPCTFQ